MNKENIKKILASNPVARPSYFRRPHWTRRNFFQLAGAGITASFLAKEAKAQASDTCTSQSMTTINKATNVIFILMAGAPSHVDTFDFKNTAGVTPAAAAPRNGERHPLAHRNFPQARRHHQPVLDRALRAGPRAGS